MALILSALCHNISGKSVSSPMGSFDFLNSAESISKQTFTASTVAEGSKPQGETNDPGLCVCRSACQRLLPYTRKIPRSVCVLNSSRALIGCKDVQLDKISFVFYCFAFGTHKIQAPSLGLQIF